MFVVQCGIRLNARIAACDFVATGHLKHWMDECNYYCWLKWFGDEW